MDVLVSGFRYKWVLVENNLWFCYLLGGGFIEQKNLEGMADQGGLEGSQPVDLKKHPSGIVPTLQWVPIYM